MSIEIAAAWNIKIQTRSQETEKIHEILIQRWDKSSGEETSDLVGRTHNQLEHFHGDIQPDREIRKGMKGERWQE
jgi:hypothetical protein